MNKKLLIGFILLIVVALVILVFLYKTDSSQENEIVAFTETTPSAAQQNATLKVVRELSKPIKTLSSDEKGMQLNIYDLFVTLKGFVVSDFVVKKGTIVQLNIVNKTTTPIDLFSQTLGLDISSIAPETTANISIDASKEGNFELICNKQCPPGIKLLGRLIIQ